MTGYFSTFRRRPLVKTFFYSISLSPLGLIRIDARTSHVEVIVFFFYRPLFSHSSLLISLQTSRLNFFFFLPGGEVPNKGLEETPLFVDCSTPFRQLSLEDSLERLSASTPSLEEDSLAWTQIAILKL